MRGYTMLKMLLPLFIAVAISPGLCQQPAQDRSLIPPGIRAIATPDDSAIILISGPDDSGGSILEWLGIGAIACDADNSLIVWSESVGAPRPTSQSPVPNGPARAFVWPEGIENGPPFDIDRSITSERR